MKTKVALSVLLAALCACTHADMTYLPDGRQGYTVQCNGRYNSNADCVKKAGELCGASGYDVMGTDNEATGFLSAIAGPNVGSLNGGTHMNRSMLIACKK